jgi:hypothetical protein
MIKAALGWMIIGFGTVIFIIPAMGWPGAIIVGAGGILVLRNSRWSRRRFVEMGKRYPGTVGRARHWIAGKVQARLKKEAE